LRGPNAGSLFNTSMVNPASRTMPGIQQGRQSHKVAVRLPPDLPNTNHSIPNQSRQIPLLLAAECWDNGVFKILLGYEEVKANITEDNGRTPPPGLHIPESIRLSGCGEPARCSSEAAVSARGSLVANLEIDILVA